MSATTEVVDPVQVRRLTGQAAALEAALTASTIRCTCRTGLGGPSCLDHKDGRQCRSCRCRYLAQQLTAELELIDMGLVDS